jgi:hypothetical protein
MDDRLDPGDYGIQSCWDDDAQRAERNTKAFATRAWDEAPPNKAGPYVECHASHDAVVNE